MGDKKEQLIYIPKILRSPTFYKSMSSSNASKKDDPSCSICQFETQHCNIIKECGICEMQRQCTGCLTECNICQNGCQFIKQDQCENGCQKDQCHICEELCEIQDLGDKPSETPVPGDAIKITASEITSTSAVLTWKTTDPLADTYTIFYVLEENGIAVERLETSSSGSSTTINNLKPKSKYLINYRGENYRKDGTTVKGKTMPESSHFFTLSDIPELWEWESEIKINSPINISALELQHFFERINEVRIYKKIETYDFTMPIPNNKISANICNQAIDAIAGVYGKYNEIPGHGTLPDKAIPKETLISADYFNQLKKALNTAIK